MAGFGARWLGNAPSKPLMNGLQWGVAALLGLAVAIQLARVIWSLIAPLGPLGDWRPQTLVAPAEASQFDPFFRLQPSGPAQAVVTSLALKLFGVRVDSASGRGSAIIETPDGIQSSYAVGEEVMPGVVLKQVAYDNVTIERGGVAEQLFLDQSVAAPVAQPTPQGSSSAQVATPPPVGTKLIDSVTATPRTENGKVTGLVLQPKGDAPLFAAAGLQPGDVLMSVNGTNVASPDALSQLPATGTVSLDVERGGRRISLSAKIAQ